MTLRGENESWLKVEVRQDKDKFLLAANSSHSLQALFLLGLCEYELSGQPWYTRIVVRKFAHLPTDRRHAVATILKSLEGNPSPFADDIWFFIFEMECRCGGHQPKYDGKEFVGKYPLKQVFEYLRTKYPQNLEILNLKSAPP